MKSTAPSIPTINAAGRAMVGNSGAGIGGLEVSVTSTSSIRAPIESDTPIAVNEIVVEDPVATLSKEYGVQLPTAPTVVSEGAPVQSN